MDDLDRHWQDTREFLAEWDADREPYLTAHIAESLAAIGQRDPALDGITPPQWAALAPVVLQGLRAAATPGGVNAAIEKLRALAAADEPGTTTDRGDA